MNRTCKALAVGAITAIIGLAPAAQSSAYAGDPVVTATCDTTVVVNTPVHCTVTISLPGYAPNNQRIQWMSNGRWFNVANYTVIPVTFDGVAWNYTYTPSAGEVGRFEVFSVVVPVSTARIPRTVSGSAGFTVLAAPPVAP